MTEHPAQQFAAQAAEAAAALQEFLNPLRDYKFPGADNWPRDLTDSETAALLRQVHAAIGDLGVCVEAIAGQAAYEGPPRQHLREAGGLMQQASTEIQAARTALGTPGGQPGPGVQPRLAARDFPAAARHVQPGGPAASPPAPGATDPALRRPGTSPRPRNPRTP
jgi:hypothetical protein